MSGTALASDSLKYELWYGRPGTPVERRTLKW